EPFADPLVLPRATRQQALQEAVDRYAARLEYYALRSPLDWFNFFDFWQLPDATRHQDKE
ncbi:MAG TPA: acyltransferase, partial [Enterobacteriaceae bacterium]|nr:acyltransferase [Enterobacteriaceae bacterium]